MTLVIAHRGSSAEEVENSLAAFRLAIQEGADGVELDVHATADGELIVRHDDVLAGHAVSGMRLRDVRLHTLQNGEPIPTLAEALAAIGPKASAFVEVKALAADHDRQLLEAIDRGPAPTHCHVHSFDHRIVRRLRAQRPGLEIGVLSVSYPVRPLAQMADAGAKELWQEKSLIDRDLVDAVHEVGGKIYAWTVDEAGRLTTLADLGVDGVCTNQPALARSVLG